MSEIPSLLQEFDRQVETLVRRGYPEIAGRAPRDFLRHIEPLRERVEEIDAPGADLEAGRLPLVVVVTSDLVPAGKAMMLVERDGKQGFVKMYPREPEDFRPIDGIVIPGGAAYLMVDIDRGGETLNITPNEALRLIEMQNRSPLTIDEGIAVVTHYPEFLRKNNCYSLLASRCADQRVPAIWISEDKPRLGWCWAGNPHTWLGSASCRERIG